MKRLSLLLAALALTGGVAAGCSKTADVATPNVPNVDTDQIAGDAAKCTELAGSYATLFTTVAVDGDTAKVNAEIDKLKGQVPDSVKDDLDALGKGFSEANGQMGVAEFMSSTEFTTANETVTKYLTVECSQVGS